MRELTAIDFWPRRAVRPRRALVAMSGGVDSSFTAWLLKNSGVEVIGIHFRLGDFNSPGPGPTDFGSREAAGAARSAADQIGVPFHEFEIAEAFEREVVLPFVEAYRRGLTPNPCILCNPRIKWRFLIDQARKLEADAIATGHHARIQLDPTTGRPRLLKGLSPEKDQSYFLARLSNEQLAGGVLPAGWFSKAEIRAALKAAGLGIFDKPESQDACFVGPEGYKALVEKYLGARTPPPGEIVDLSGVRLGTHCGIHCYTVGQRKGLELAAPHPLYVIAIDPESQRLWVGGEEHTYSSEALLENMHWLHQPVGGEQEFEVKVRYKSRPAKAMVIEAAADRVRLRFLRPQRSITPGQTAVIYQGDEVLGAGFIARPGVTALAGERFSSVDDQCLRDSAREVDS